MDVQNKVFIGHLVWLMMCVGGLILSYLSVEYNFRVLGGAIITLTIELAILGLLDCLVEYGAIRK